MKRRDLRIAWASNAIWSNSGYGSFSHDLLTRMAKDGWPIATFNFYGLQGGVIELDGITHYPQMEDAWGSDALVAHGRDFGANVIFTNQDIWALQPQFLQQIKYWIPHVPIDADPAPPNVLDKLRFAYKIITFSKFGHETIAKSGFASTFITEGVDLKKFQPIDKTQARREMGIPENELGCFLFGMVAANKENPPRKSFQEALEAFEMFYAKHSEAALMIHTQQPSPAGFPVREFAQQRGFGHRLWYVDPYKAVYRSGPKEINREYNAFDCLLHPSQTEGFGLCLVESQAAGTPVIIQDCHSMPELIVEGVTGEKAKTATKRFVNNLSYWMVPDVNSIYEAMERTYARVKKDDKAVEKACQDHVVRNFDIDKIYQEKWVPYLNTLQEDILGPLPASKELANIKAQ